MVKIGLIGAGHLGKIHLKLLKNIKLAKLVGFYDIDEATRKNVEKELEVKAYKSLDELLDHCDAVDIVTPTTTHFEIAKKLIKKQKHIFIEKPVASSSKEAEELVKLSYEAGIKAQIGHVERFNPAFISAKEYINNPKFIEIHRLAQFNPRGTDVSVVYDLMIHDIDLVLNIFNSTIKKISASGVSVVSDTIDIANARLEFVNGAVANITSSRISLKKMRKMRLFQKNAYISIDFLDKKVEIIKMKDVKKQDNPFGLYFDTTKGKKQIYYITPEIKENNAIMEELNEFCKSIVYDTTPPVGIEEGSKAIKVAEEINYQIQKQYIA
ncbi:TPA: Gfo/Idh/MocA family oxidoreductase [Candidatus Peregrinibacteria bacterium]|nr:Gfo/Idh/MocA family oxidoreductase [Candidatus Peregrinibacteria bacterium]